MRELRIDVASSVASTIRAPIAIDRATEPGLIVYSSSPLRLSTGRE